MQTRRKTRAAQAVDPSTVEQAGAGEQEQAGINHWAKLSSELVDAILEERVAGERRLSKKRHQLYAFSLLASIR